MYETALSWRFASKSTTALVLLVTATTAVLRADPLDQWHRLSPLPTRDTLRAIAYGNGMFVAVGDQTVLTSHDGVSWQSPALPVAVKINWYYGVCHADGKFVAVGAKGSRDAGAIATSPDGINWTNHDSGTASWLFDVTFGNGQFVAVGDRGVVVTSADAVTWGIGGTCPSSLLSGVAFGDQKFVAVFDRIYTSLDAFGWLNQKQVDLGSFPGVAYLGGQFVAVGASNGTNALTSPDGVTWAERITSTSSSQALRRVTYGNEYYVAVGIRGSLVISSNAIDWMPRNASTSNDLFGIAYGNGRFVAVGERGTVITSENAKDWLNRGPIALESLTSATATRGLDIIVGDSAATLVSSNPPAWERVPTGANSNVVGVFDVNGRFMASLAGGGILASANGLDWTPCSVEQPFTVRGIGFGSGRYVAVGDLAGGLWISDDGSAWILRSAPTGFNYLSDVAHGAEAWVAVGQNGRIIRSTNGLAWNTVNSGTSSPLKGVAFAEGQFVVVGGNSALLKSPDGLAWNTITTTNAADLNDVAYGDGIFVVVGSNGMILSSDDGSTWVRRSPGITDHLYAVSYGKGRFLAIGASGTILQSDPLSLAPIRLDLRSTNGFELTLTGPFPRTYDIEYADQLPPNGSWKLLRVAPLTNSPFIWTDLTQVPMRFYRAVLQQ